MRRQSAATVWKPDEEHRLSGGGVAWRLRRYVITIEGDKNVQRKIIKG